MKKEVKTLELRDEWGNYIQKRKKSKKRKVEEILPQGEYVVYRARKAPRIQA
jgi:hypothetical protein